VSDPKIVASAKEQRRAPPESVESGQAWAMLGWIGIAFLVVGGADFVLTWIPPDFGNREWEFGTVTASFNGLPILLLGLGLLIAASQQMGRRWWGTLGMVGSVGLLLWVLVGIALWASNIQLALQTVPDELAVGVQRALVKTLVQSVVYTLALVYLMFRSWLAGKGSTASP
jgi:hypothetical protein